MNLRPVTTKALAAVLAAASVCTAAAGAVVLPGAGGIAPTAIVAEAAAPGTPQYIQAVNKAILYSEGVYEGDHCEPLSLADTIACAFADAKPKSEGISYALVDNYQRQPETIGLTWSGANITGRSDRRGDYTPEVWSYGYDANGYLNKIAEVPQSGYGSYYGTNGASISIQLGADGRPAAMNAPMIYPWYADHQQRMYAFAYDKAGRITAMSQNITDSEAGTTTTAVLQYIYNPNGTLKMVADATNGRYQSFHYDKAGRLAMSFDENTGEYANGDSAVAYSYDKANRPKAAVAYQGGVLNYQKSYNY